MIMSRGYDRYSDPSDTRCWHDTAAELLGPQREVQTSPEL